MDHSPLKLDFTGLDNLRRQLIIPHAMNSESLKPVPHPPASLPAHEALYRILEDFATEVPTSTEQASLTPHMRAAELLRVAGLKAGAVSAGLAVAPGPLGILTVIPDLIKVWRIQQQMVADIAACYGKSAQLNPQLMVYCLFRHGAAMLLRDVVARVGERLIVKEAGLRVIQQVLRRVGVQVTQKAVGKSLSRWLPVIGPVLIGGYSWMDTRKVGKTAIDTFSRPIEIEGSGEASIRTLPQTKTAGLPPPLEPG